MDWSLVLASQGIEATLEHFPEAEGWLLLVEPTQHARAIEAIKLYRVENRRWAWRQQLTWSGLTFHWGALFWCWLLILFHWMADAFGGRLELAGAMNDQVHSTGQWWRLFTAVTLHSDLGHLAANVSTGLVLLGLSMARYGAGMALLAALLAGAAGNLLGLLLRPQPYVGLGASGMVMGALGLLAAQSAALLRRSAHPLRQVLTGVVGGMFLFLLLGLDPRSDVLAHLGGFLAGALFGAALALLGVHWGTHGRWDAAAGTAAGILALGAWLCAFL